MRGTDVLPRIREPRQQGGNIIQVMGSSKLASRCQSDVALDATVTYPDASGH